RGQIPAEGFKCNPRVTFAELCRQTHVLRGGFSSFAEVLRQPRNPFAVVELVFHFGEHQAAHGRADAAQPVITLLAFIECAASLSQLRHGHVAESDWHFIQERVLPVIHEWASRTSSPGATRCSPRRRSSAAMTWALSLRQMWRRRS